MMYYCYFLFINQLIQILLNFYMVFKLILGIECSW